MLQTSLLDLLVQVVCTRLETQFELKLQAGTGKAVFGQGWGGGRMATLRGACLSVSKQDAAPPGRLKC